MNSRRERRRREFYHDHRFLILLFHLIHYYLSCLSQIHRTAVEGKTFFRAKNLADCPNLD